MSSMLIYLFIIMKRDKPNTHLDINFNAKIRNSINYKNNIDIK